jgi:D-serine deaminase-like pyridoxal phosphate-dependent protein
MNWAEARAALAGERLPAAFVDLDALDRNLERQTAMLAPRATPLRIATKSVRAVGILRRLVERGGAAVRGLMCFSAAEAEFLAAQGFDDFLIAYPVWRDADVAAVARLTAAGKTVSVAADAVETIDRLAAADARIKVVLCLDMAWTPLGLYFGVRRSPLRSVDDVRQLARHAATRAQFHGLLAYEAQVAGLGDDSPHQSWQNGIKALIRHRSAADVARRRSAIVRALTDDGLAPKLVNGGGTGSLDTTTPSSGVTEVTAGSGFYKPHLFDYYRSAHMRALEPACFFAVEVTRRPRADLVTCLGGGYVASGPPAPDRAPVPWLPEGLRLLPMEMAGEVQTPLRVPDGVQLELGDPVVMRHAKAGELLERFNELLLVRGGAIVDRVPTYRGQGQCFL